MAPDTLEWVDLDVGYTGWLGAMLTEGLEKFYATPRWPGWQDEVGKLDGAQAMSFYPFLRAGGVDAVLADSRPPQRSKESRVIAERGLPA